MSTERDGSTTPLGTCVVCHAHPVHGGCQAPGCPALSDGSVASIPERIMRCARCGYDAWRPHYPCGRCGGVEPVTYVRASRGFPWPCPADIKAAAAAIAKKREQIAEAHVLNSMVDPPGPPRAMTDEECVLQVLWSLRGDA